MKNKHQLCALKDLENKKPAHELINGLDLVIVRYGKEVSNYFEATTDLMKVIARACGNDDFTKFSNNDLTTFDYDLHLMTGINYGGVGV